MNRRSVMIAGMAALGVLAAPGVWAAGVAYGGVAFGLVPGNALVPNGAQSVAPAGSVYYPHSYTAGSAGLLSLATSATASPATAGWSEVIYQDNACSGQYAAGDAIVSAALPVTAGQVVCVLLREYAPATAPPGATNRVSLTATLVYSGSAAPAPQAQSVTDTTTVSGSGLLTLQKQVQNVTLGGAYGVSGNAAPGQLLQYQITITNDGLDSATAVSVSDATPAYTTFVSAACPPPATLPPTLSSCTVAVQPAVGAAGALQWTFVGALAPGAQTTVVFQVRVAP